MLQNPHRRRCGRYCEADEIGEDYQAWPRRGVAGDERPVIGDMDGAERTQDSPNKNRAGPLRYKTRPADPFSPDLRYKTLPARSKSPYLARFARAGRTLYRMRGRDGASHHSTPRPTSVEGAEGLAVVPVGDGGARLGFKPTRPATHQRHSTTGVEGAGGAGGPGCGARGRWQGLAGLRDDAPSEARGADGERAGRRPRAHKAARPTHRAARPTHRAARPARARQRPEHSGSTQRGARSAAAPRAPRVCQLLTG